MISNQVWKQHLATCCFCWVREAKRHDSSGSCTFDAMHIPEGCHALVKNAEHGLQKKRNTGGCENSCSRAVTCFSSVKSVLSKAAYSQKPSSLDGFLKKSDIGRGLYVKCRVGGSSGFFSSSCSLPRDCARKGRSSESQPLLMHRRARACQLVLALLLPCKQSPLNIVSGKTVSSDKAFLLGLLFLLRLSSCFRLQWICTSWVQAKGRLNAKVRAAAAAFAAISGLIMISTLAARALHQAGCFLTACPAALNNAFFKAGSTAFSAQATRPAGDDIMYLQQV